MDKFDTYYDDFNAVSGHPEFGPMEERNHSLSDLVGGWRREDLREDLFAIEDDELAEAA